MNWKEIIRIVEEALGIEIDDKVIRNVAVSVICFFVALVAVWWLP